MHTFKTGDKVTFAKGKTAAQIASEVGGLARVWQRHLSIGDIVTDVSDDGHTIRLKNCGYNCLDHLVQLMKPGKEKPAKWAARWSKMMEV